MTTPTIGERFRLKTHVGYDPSIDESHPKHPSQADRPVRAPDGSWVVDMHLGMHPLFEGQIGTVVEVIRAGSGVYVENHEDHIGLLFTHRLFTSHGNEFTGPEHVETPHQRSVSFTAAQLAELFEPVSDVEVA
jgi:hypothetical protein